MPRAADPVRAASPWATNAVPRALPAASWAVRLVQPKGPPRRPERPTIVVPIGAALGYAAAFILMILSQRQPFAWLAVPPWPAAPAALALAR